MCRITQKSGATLLVTPDRQGLKFNHVMLKNMKNFFKKVVSSCWNTNKCCLMNFSWLIFNLEQQMSSKNRSLNRYQLKWILKKKRLQALLWDYCKKEEPLNWKLRFIQPATAWAQTMHPIEGAALILLPLWRILSWDLAQCESRLACSLPYSRGERECK